MQRDERTVGYDAPAIVDVEDLIGLLSGGTISGPMISSEWDDGDGDS